MSGKLDFYKLVEISSESQQSMSKRKTRKQIKRNDVFIKKMQERKSIKQRR